MGSAPRSRPRPRAGARREGVAELPGPGAGSRGRDGRAEQSGAAVQQRGRRLLRRPRRGNASPRCRVASPKVEEPGKRSGLFFPAAPVSVGARAAAEL